MPALPYPVYDADHHLYEPEEAFMRHLPKAYEKDFYLVDVKGRKKLAIGGAISEYIPNPTFEVVAAPGKWEKYMRADNPESLSLRELSGKGLRPPPEWRSGDGRVAVLDQQGLHAAMVFPTLASVIESRLGDKPDVMAALFHSLNMWTNEEWGFARENRLFSVPMINLANIDLALAELDFVLKAGARVIGIRPAPVATARGSRSFGYPDFDPFWARIAEAKVFVCFHASDTGYERVLNWWLGGDSEMIAFKGDGLRSSLNGMMGNSRRDIVDSISNMIAFGVFDRHPDLRVVSVENGSDWVEALVQRMNHTYGQMPKEFKRHPRDTFNKHVFVAPYYEDDMTALKQYVPAERMLFGSDFPHPEGLAEPLDYLKEFDGFKDDEIKKVFSTNLKGLLEGARD
jgi:predicted TIM-barrel fold metal-dependent hydrolase